MKVQSTREIWTLKTGKRIEATAEEIAEIALHFAPMVDVDLPPILTTNPPAIYHTMQPVIPDPPTPPQPGDAQP